jgi:hypothetical protein
MRIHSDILTWADMYNAARKAGVVIEDLDRHASRSRATAFVFYLSGSSNYMSNNRDHKAATWDEWGMFLAHLFSVDPQAHSGKNSYQSAEHFHWTTGNRFENLTPAYQHKRHNWGMGHACVTGSYSTAECNDCEAIQRWVLRPHTWEEINS